VMCRKISDSTWPGRALNSMPGRRRPGWGPNRESKSMERMSGGFFDDLQNIGEHSETKAKLSGEKRDRVPRR